MNNVAITATIASAPRYTPGVPRTSNFDVTVTTTRRDGTLHITTYNDLAASTRHLRIGDRVAVTGYLRSEPFDMPDGTVRHRVEIVAYEIDREPALTAAQREATS